MFTDELTSIREQRKLTKHDLARLTGLSVQHIHNLEAGRRPLTLDVLRKLDACLHFPARVLVAAVRGHASLQVLSRAVVVVVGLMVGV